MTTPFIPDHFFKDSIKLNSLLTKVYIGLMLLGVLAIGLMLLSVLTGLLLCLLLGLSLIFLKRIKRKISKEPENEDLDQIPDFLR
jgi:hypothetical protein